MNGLKYILKTNSSLRLKASIRSQGVWLDLKGNLEISQAHLDASYVMALTIDHSNYNFRLNHHFSDYRYPVNLLNSKEHTYVANTCRNLGTVFLLSKQNYTVLFYNKKAIGIGKCLHYYWDLSIYSRNIAKLDMVKKDYNRAISYLKAAYDLQKRNSYYTDSGATTTF